MSALCQKRTSGHSLNYLLGALLKLQRHVEAEGFGGLEIDYQFEFDWCLDWKLGRLLSFENAVDIGSGGRDARGKRSDFDSGRPRPA
jgi:hypothetical protein